MSWGFVGMAEEDVGETTTAGAGYSEAQITTGTGLVIGGTAEPAHIVGVQIMHDRKQPGPHVGAVAPQVQTVEGA